MDRHWHELIAAYGMAGYLLTGWIETNLKIHFGRDTFKHFDRWFNLAPGQTYEPVVGGAAIMLVMWLILYYMYRNKIFVRI